MVVRGLARAFQFSTPSTTTIEAAPLAAVFGEWVPQAHTAGPAISHYAIPRTRISAFGASLTSTGPRSPKA